MEHKLKYVRKVMNITTEFTLSITSLYQTPKHATAESLLAF